MLENKEEFELNTRPLLLKRIVSDAFDLTCLFILFILVSVLLEATPIANTYKMHTENYKAIQQEVLSSNDVNDVNEILLNNNVYQNEVFAANLHRYLLRCIEALISEFIVFVLIPFMNKDGVSLGKLLTGIMLFDESRQTKINKGQIVLRFIFIYLISVGFYPWTGIYSFLAIPVLRFIILILNDKHKTLCDYLTSSMYIEKLTYSSFD